MATIRLATLRDAAADRGDLCAVLRRDRHFIRRDGADRRRDGAAHCDDRRDAAVDRARRRTVRVDRVCVCVAASRACGVSLVGEHRHLHQPRRTIGAAPGARSTRRCSRCSAHLGYRRRPRESRCRTRPASGLHAAFGFAPVGVYRHIGYKMGAWHDVGWYQAEIQPRVGAAGGSALDSRDCVDSPEWHDAVERGLAYYGATVKTKNEKRKTNKCRDDVTSFILRFAFRCSRAFDVR